MNNERVTPKNAAKELQMDVITLRELMKREKLPIGYAIKREGKSKWGFYIYRHLLDNKLINSLNEIARRNRSQNVATAADQMVPQIYAAIAIALHRTYGFGYKRINDVFVESQHIWESYAGDGAGMVKKCEEETGVTVCSTEEAQRLMEGQNGM